MIIIFPLLFLLFKDIKSPKSLKKTNRRSEDSDEENDYATMRPLSTAQILEISSDQTLVDEPKSLGKTNRRSDDSDEEQDYMTMKSIFSDPFLEISSDQACLNEEMQSGMDQSEDVQEQEETVQKETDKSLDGKNTKYKRLVGFFRKFSGKYRKHKEKDIEKGLEGQIIQNIHHQEESTKNICNQGASVSVEPSTSTNEAVTSIGVHNVQQDGEPSTTGPFEPKTWRYNPDYSVSSTIPLRPNVTVSKQSTRQTILLSCSSLESPLFDLDQREIIDLKPDESPFPLLDHHRNQDCVFEIIIMLFYSPQFKQNIRNETHLQDSSLSKILCKAFWCYDTLLYAQSHNQSQFDQVSYVAKFRGYMQQIVSKCKLYNIQHAHSCTKYIHHSISRILRFLHGESYFHDTNLSAFLLTTISIYYCTLCDAFHFRGVYHFTPFMEMIYHQETMEKLLIDKIVPNASYFASNCGMTFDPERSKHIMVELLPTLFIYLKRNKRIERCSGTPARIDIKIILHIRDKCLYFLKVCLLNMNHRIGVIIKSNGCWFLCIENHSYLIKNIIGFLTGRSDVIFCIYERHTDG